MTSAAINDYSVMAVYPGSKQSDYGVVGQTDEKNSFQNAMTQAQNTQTSAVKETTARTQTTVSVTKTADSITTRNNTSKTGQTDSDTKTAKTTDASKSDKTADSDKTVNNGKADKADKAVKDAAETVEKDVVKEVAKELDVTEDEVEEAMETLGLTVLDLMDQTNMAALVTELTGESDPAVLLTDAGLFDTVCQLSENVVEIVEQGVEELADDLGMDSEELVQMLETAVQNADVTQTTAEQRGVVVEVETDEEPVSTDNRTETVQTTDDSQEAEQPVAETVGDVKEESSKGQNESMNYNQEQPSFVDTAFRSDAVAAETVQETEQSFTSYVDTEDIINQIGEYVKIHQSEGLSEMEISLNPESLGNIHLQVASKEGMITATITAQNETVRDALMVQAMVLKDELSEQGLKVEAVEVTVASHEFERNMKDGGEEAQNLFEQQVRKQTRRRIVLDNLMQAEDLLADENLTDAERLQIDMMAKSGNSVDFTA